MSLDNMFIEGPQFSETALIKLPQDPEQWQDEIINHVKSQYPQIDSLPITVNFTKISEEDATGIGSVIVSHPHVNKTAFLPVVVKNNMMYPIDIWQDDEKKITRPITDDTFETYFFNEKTFDSLEKKPAGQMSQYFDDPSLWQSTYPPLQGRYSYASVKGALLGEVLETLTKEDAQAFEQAAGDRSILFGYKQSGNLELIEKVAKKAMKISKCDDMPMSNHSMKDLPLTTNLAVLRKDPKGYSILSSSDGLFMTASYYKNEQECRDYLEKEVREGRLTGHPEDFMNGVIHNGEKVLKSNIQPLNKVHIQDDHRNAAVKATKFGVYRVRRLYDGVLEKGIFIPKVVDYHGNKKDGQTIFLGGTNSILQGSVAGIPAPTKADLRSRIGELMKDSGVQSGQVGTFIVFEGDEAIATEPIQVVRADYDCNRGNFRVADFNGNVFYIRRDHEHNPHSVQEITFNKGGHNGIDQVIIPKRAVWVPMSGFRPVASSPKEYLEKTAGMFHEDKPLTVTWTGLNFEVKGRNFEKNASGFDPYSMSESDVQFVAFALGADAFTTKRMIKVAKEKGKAVVHGLRAVSSIDPALRAAKMKKEATALYCRNLKRNLIKEASVVSDRSTVDAVLSLNFINPQNIKKFVEALPVLTAAHFKLSDLVLGARLGIETVPHDAAVVCMKRMGEVIKGLRALDQSLSPLAQKAQAKSKAISQEPSQELGSA